MEEKLWTTDCPSLTTNWSSPGIPMRMESALLAHPLCKSRDHSTATDGDASGDCHTVKKKKKKKKSLYCGRLRICSHIFADDVRGKRNCVKIQTWLSWSLSDRPSPTQYLSALDHTELSVLVQDLTSLSYWKSQGPRRARSWQCSNSQGANLAMSSQSSKYQRNRILHW